jgi:hypothetical protein
VRSDYERRRCTASLSGDTVRICGVARHRSMRNPLRTRFIRDNALAGIVSFFWTSAAVGCCIAPGRCHAGGPGSFGVVPCEIQMDCVRMGFAHRRQMGSSAAAGYRAGRLGRARTGKRVRPCTCGIPGCVRREFRSRSARSGGLRGGLPGGEQSGGAAGENPGTREAPRADRLGSASRGRAGCQVIRRQPCPVALTRSRR